MIYGTDESKWDLRSLLAEEQTLCDKIEAYDLRFMTPGSSTQLAYDQENLKQIRAEIARRVEIARETAENRRQDLLRGSTEAKWEPNDIEKLVQAWRKLADDLIAGGASAIGGAVTVHVLRKCADELEKVYAGLNPPVGEDAE